MEDRYDEYLTAMKRVQRESIYRNSASVYMSPRERRRKSDGRKQSTNIATESLNGVEQAKRISTMASFVPDEIVYKHSDLSVRTYETALMFIDVSGFTDLCEAYTRTGRGGPSRLTQVLNSYIGAMVQEILTHNGDILKFSGDAFLSMWKKTPSGNMQDVVHNAIDCGLLIQKNYGRYVTDVGVALKVKVAISAGVSHFSIIGGGELSLAHYVIVGQPVWDVKTAEYMSSAGDVLTTASAWIYVNEAEYCTQPCGDGRHTKVLGIGATWKRVEKLHSLIAFSNEEPFECTEQKHRPDGTAGVNLREFSLRPAVVAAIRGSWGTALRRFMLRPILRAVDNDEPMNFLAEVRHVLIVFINIITKTVTADILISVVDAAYRRVCGVTAEAGGLVNKVSMFDKDMMFLVVFGLRGLKHEDEARKALECALTLKENLKNSNIISVSIGVTSGSTYCGVVGHVLRREYTVIGSAVNKAARLMTTYLDKVTCDKETFLKSKLDHDHFKLMEEKPLKGFSKPGPIYEYNKQRRSDHLGCWRHPLLGRNEELRIYKMTLHNALEQQNYKFTRFRDHKFGIAFITPFGLMRKIVATIFSSHMRPARESRENRIRLSVDVTSLRAVEILAVNTIFDCRFPLPEKFSYAGDFLGVYDIKKIIKEIFIKNIPSLRLVAVTDAQYADDESWRVILLLLDIKKIFFLFTIRNTALTSAVANTCLENDMIVKLEVSGIDRWYHAALVCQMLDVQAIPADLEKMIESASNGMPGWIQNFVISLVQSGDLTIATVTRSEARETGAVMPSISLLQRPDHDLSLYDESLGAQASIYSLNISFGTKQEAMQETDVIQMAVLADSYTFEDIKGDVKMDVLILKTYDSLSPFEKMVLKCSSVLGEVFSRRVLQHLLQTDEQRKVAQAVAKLFSIRVLECEGGDFTRDSSLVLVHPAPVPNDCKAPYCRCLGIRPPLNCKDLPMYAFCGYMKFKHIMFRTTTYELLTENQKRNMHTRALLYLERYTRRCVSCGGGCFVKFLGLRCNDGLIRESDELKRVREQISGFSAETKTADEQYTHRSFAMQPSMELTMNVRRNTNTTILTESEGLAENERRIRRLTGEYGGSRDGRPFFSYDFSTCECLPILLSAYCQAVDHCFGAEEFEKLFEAYLEYTDLSAINLNMPQAIRLLFEVETLINSEKFRTKNKCDLEWINDFRLGRILSHRGACLLESGDLDEAKKLLLEALKLFSDPFPSSKHATRLRHMCVSFSQLMAFYIAPQCYVARDRGVSGQFYECIAWTLISLNKVFIECREKSNAVLAAKWAMNYALRTDSNFRLLCMCYGNMITLCAQERDFSKCEMLEQRSMDICNRKIGKIDVTEVQAAGYLYTNIFLFHVESGKRAESIELGLEVMRMMSSITELRTRQVLVLWILKLLLAETRVHDMIAIMREFFYMTDHYDLSSETWYYYYAMVILLDTGHTVESYKSCERFYLKKGDAILRSKTSEAAWNFFVCMWLVTIRVGIWEKSIMWEDKIKQLVSMKYESHEFCAMILVRLIEGLLISMVQEIDNRNVRKIQMYAKLVKSLFGDLNSACKQARMYQPRYFLLLAYYNCISDKKSRAFRKLSKATQLCRQHQNTTLLIWIDHTRNHWNGTLKPILVNYWTEHINVDHQMGYRELDTTKGEQIIPYTLPLPKDMPNYNNI
ncbi:PREDICTED: adenylate cyclase type 10-like isoform X2 [Papilio xuthus]|uniref:Adenylate cyclase type 10-like isoform X2 n=1 Tax=Papilio xuthus TaxID=66420 RepID=A0AAJ7E522_PAPXU|nr:PREDICTED: adenylate cyclase type 10-like isoform X2 [Papilio xuthus]